MSIFSQKGDKEGLMLAFHIGSSSVNGALFVAQKSGVPKIIFSVREQVPIEKDIDIDRLLSLTLESLAIVSSKIAKAGYGAPTQIFCTLASPWYVSQTRIINMERNTPFVFTEKLANGLIQKEKNIFEQENRVLYNGVDNKVRTIEIKNIRTMLNGYDTANPLNQSGKQLDMTMFISMSGEQVLGKIEEIIGQYFRFERIQYSSFVLASFSVVRDMYAKSENFLLLDIGGEVTDISMIKKNILRESTSFPLGRNFLIRGVAESLSCTIDEASSLVSLFKDGHAEEKVEEKLAPIMSYLRTEWLKRFQDSLANLSHDISIPAAIYIAIDKDLADFFAETIRSEQFNQYTLTASKFEITFLGTETFHSIAEFNESVIREPFLIIDSIYNNRFLTRM